MRNTPASAADQTPFGLCQVPPETCPNCGADVPRNAPACPECGACEETGWSEEAGQSNLSLPDDEFNYDSFVKREFGPQEKKPVGISWLWWAVSLAITGVLLWLALR